MFTSNTLPAYGKKGAASAARARLMQDSAMRRNHPTFNSRTLLPSPLTVTFATLATEPDITTVLPDAESLTPAEQQQRALQIARTLKGGYLADLTYLADRRIAVATVCPILDQRNPLDVPHKVCVDADGNVSVIRNDPHAASQRLVLSRLLLVVGAFISALGALSVLTLM
ncbi:MAG TPA: hypothetical protein PKD09_25115 [Aggregatilinea sp.]|jgi:hypothetical protein|uniref:hypothetical protein n=1 Tax=Aggregatilinea sp. TaxID=2806333 RepID=UPI002CB42FE5|nr:hypothetical protein [Aggregatilinea sp.]HML24959.1 hypothetical protein [Aggregatilinea sp.]